MLPPRCFTCNKILSHIELPYEEEIKKIDKFNKVTDEHRKKYNNLTDDEIIKEIKSLLKVKLLNTYGLKRYCCRKMIITYYDKNKIVM